MAQKEISLQVPEELLESLGGAEKVQRRALESLLLSLIEEGEVTPSYAAEVLGISYRKMLQVMAERHVPLVNYDPDDLTQEVKALDKFFS